ncbi:MBL fold metallo-hydrolase [Actomonas aquatica]|uniref:MBL fold metallo-hydrolase n=1 Tax=Actomonas aquatica TaxID=2866162 RepID=A0ABZ1C9I6_9BACT|nr:MBL fold metallo-hydrolase [Opitutus sp. WL0086]WRQ87249.1 MBL fold metallo-hydrolase [Opitutus sp. WL0086]
MARSRSPRRRFFYRLLRVSGAVGLLGIVVLLVLMFFSGFPRNLGKGAQGERLARIQQSPQYQDGVFRNEEPTSLFTGDKGRMAVMWEFMFGPKTQRKPGTPLPVVATDLQGLPADRDTLVWLGHSSFYFQFQGHRILIDPVLGDYAAPLSPFNRAFKGPYPFPPESIPAVDFLLITHDHYDHLDYQTLRAIRERVGRVIVPLGVGAHLEHWGFDPAQIREVDWHDTVSLAADLTLHALPARHFSGRGLGSNKTLWVSYLFEGAARKVYFSGDSGYDGHFKKIGERFGGVDLAIMEDGQYDPSWAQIHMLPREVAQASVDLQAAAVIPCHAGRFTLSNHSWDAPYRDLAKASEALGVNLLTPRMGEVYHLDDPTPGFEPWWEYVGEGAR